jgi:hypothetical protein
MKLIFIPNPFSGEILNIKNYFRGRVFSMAIILASALLFQECYMFRVKNQCSACPPVKKKKIRKSSKGSI